MKIAVKPSKTIRGTKRYDSFKLLGANRDINTNNVSRIIENYNEGIDLFIYNPILVSTKGEIYDGQHRFMACKELGIPVYYVVIEEQSIDSLIKLNNAQKSWGQQDYLNSFIARGNEEYIALRDFMEFYNLSMGMAIEILSLNRCFARDFKKGLFKRDKTNRPDTIAEWFNRLSDLNPKFNNRSIVRSLIKMIAIEGFDFERFMHKMSYRHDDVHSHSSLKEQLREFEGVYNHKNRDHKNDLRFF